MPVLILKMDKSRVDIALTFLVLFGEFPNNNGNILRISLPSEKAIRRGNIISAHIASGHIWRSELDKLSGRLPFSQTAILGRFGQSILRPLYNRLKAKHYSINMGIRELQAIRRRETSIGQTQPRIAYHKPEPPNLSYTPKPVFNNAIRFGANTNQIEIQTRINSRLSHRIANLGLTGRTIPNNIIFTWP